MQLNTFDEILDFAIQLEEKAIKFYGDLSEKVRSPVVKQVCLDLKAEEEKHKIKLLEVKEQEIENFTVTPINDLELAELLQDIDFTKNDFSYQQALTLAMKREKFSAELYTKLATEAQDSQLKDLFAFLAQEEKSHKHKIESEYDEIILKDN